MAPYGAVDPKISPERQARHQPKVIAGAATMFHNQDLEDRIAGIQAEF